MCVMLLSSQLRLRLVGSLSQAWQLPLPLLRGLSEVDRGERVVGKGRKGRAGRDSRRVYREHARQSDIKGGRALWVGTDGK